PVALHSIRFCRSAIATACARSEAPSFSYRRFRWVFTVSSEIDRKLAISLLLCLDPLERRCSDCGSHHRDARRPGQGAGTDSYRACRVLTAWLRPAAEAEMPRPLSSKR